MTDIDFSKIGSWQSVVALIIGYAIVQIVLSAKAETAPFSYFALIILAVVALAIIWTQRHDTRPTGQSVDYARGAEASLKEFLEDVEDRQKGAADPIDRDYLKKMQKDIKERAKTAERYLKELKANDDTSKK